MRAFVGQVGGWTRFIVFIPVLGVLASAVTLVVLGAIETVHVIGGLFLFDEHAPKLKETLVDFIEIADLFLLAVVLYIIALGLFELFIDSELSLPHWLRFNDLDDLKHRLLGVVVVVLAVLFLGKAIQTTDSQSLFWTGAATAAVIGSIAFYMRGPHNGGGHEPNGGAAHDDGSDTK